MASCLRLQAAQRLRAKRSLRPILDDLELRVAPAGSSIPVGYAPAQIRAAYGINQITFGTTIRGDGSGQTIALVDCYNDPKIANDLSQFDQEFDLPAPSFTVLNEYGTNIGASGYAGPLPGTGPSDPNGGTWQETEALDVEWTHSIAPGASIILIECNSDTAADLLTGVTTAANLANVSVVSVTGQSTGPDPTLQSVDNAFTTPSGQLNGVTFVAPTGDAGSPGWTPAYSGNVLAVGGTSLPLGSDGDYPGTGINGETAWSGSGGGPITGLSQYEPQPAYQAGVVPSSMSTINGVAERTIPDVAFDADPNTGVAVYDSFSNGAATPWVMVGGTSLSATCWAGLIAIADQGRVAAGATTLDGPSQTLPALYSPRLAGDFHDITSGDNGTFNAEAGYDLVTGLGTPQANVLVNDLASYQLNSQLVVSSQPPSSVTAGDPFASTFVVENSFGNVVTTFNGSVTVAFGSNPGGGPLRAR